MPTPQAPPTLPLFAKDSIHYYDDFEDPRVVGRCKHVFRSVLILVLTATLAGCQGWLAIRRYGLENLDMFISMAPFPNGIPSEDTIRTICGKIPPEELQRCLEEAAADNLKRSANLPPGRPSNDQRRKVVGFDGKTCRRAVVPGQPASKVHNVSAVSDGMVLGAMKVPDKKNENSAFGVLLSRLGARGLLAGNVVAGDALNFQGWLIDEARVHGADYMFSVKANKKKLFQGSKALFLAVEENPDDFVTTSYDSPWDKAHGRIEKRRTTVVQFAPDPNRPKTGNKGLSKEEEQAKFDNAKRFVPMVGKYTDARSLALIERTYEPANGGKVVVSKRHYITSLTVPAKTIHELRLRYWQVETLHNKLDVAMGEDASRIYAGENPQFMSFFRKMALNVLVPYAKIWGEESIGSLMTLVRVRPEFRKALLTMKPKEVGSPDSWRLRQSKCYAKKRPK